MDGENIRAAYLNGTDPSNNSEQRVILSPPASPPPMIMPPLPQMIMPPPPSMRTVGPSGNRDPRLYINDDDVVNVRDIINLDDVDDDDDDDDDDDNEDHHRNEADGIGNPSRVRNLRDILNYSTRMTANAAAANNAIETIDLTMQDEKKNFLSNVLSTMSVNVQEEMHNSINILLDSEKNVEEHEYAFDVVGEYIDNIDYANDFQKLGGFQIITPGLKSEHESVRSKTAEMIAILVQNNPYCQDKFIEHPTYIRLLMSIVERDPVDEVRVKALHAISSLVRQNVSVFWKFINIGGTDLIVNALKTSIDKLKVKAVFLIYSTCHMGNDIAELYVENGVVEIICSIIMDMEKSLGVYHHELCLSTLNQFLRMSPIKVKEICTKFEDLKKSLLSLQNSYPNETNYQDEKDQILWLMETLTL